MMTDRDTLKSHEKDISSAQLIEMAVNSSPDIFGIINITDPTKFQLLFQNPVFQQTICDPETPAKETDYNHIPEAIQSQFRNTLFPTNVGEKRNHNELRFSYINPASHQENFLRLSLDRFTQQGEEMVAVTGANITDAVLVAHEKEFSTTHDNLTGLLNRKGLDKAFHSLNFDQREDMIVDNITLIFIDMDGLKLINDSQGHDAGDTYIKNFAAQLKDFFRNYDIISRYNGSGGDEFLVALPFVDAEQAKKVLEKINQHRLQPGVIPFSFGMASSSRNEESLFDFGLMTTEADKQMYVDKNSRKSAKTEPDYQI